MKKLLSSLILLPSLTTLAFGESGAVYNSNYFKLPDQTNISRLANAPGQMGYNVNAKAPEFWNGTAWIGLGGGGGGFDQNGNYTLTGSWTFNGPMTFGNSSAVRASLGAAESGTNSSITSLNGLQGLNSGDIWIAGPNGVGMIDSGFKLLGTYVGIVPPGSNDDSTKGYVVGSSGVNTATGVIYVCQSSTPGAAVWVVTSIPGIATYIGTVAPGSSTDALQGFSVGSMGINTLTGRTFMAKSVAAGAAVWVSNGRQIASPVVGNWHVASGQAGALAASQAVGSATTVVLTPFLVGVPITVNGLGSRVAVAGATGALFAEAIYASDPATNLPTGVPIVKGSDLSGEATGAIVGNASPTASISSPGLYWSAQEVNNITLAFTGPTTGLVGEYVGSGNQSIITSATGAVSCVSASSSAYGTWPDMTAATLAFPTTSKCGVLLYRVSSVAP